MLQARCCSRMWQLHQEGCGAERAPRELPLPKELEAAAASADSAPNADLLLLAAKEAKALPEGPAGASAQQALGHPLPSI